MDSGKPATPIIRKYLKLDDFWFGTAFALLAGEKGTPKRGEKGKMQKTLSLLFAGALVASAATFTGVVTDTMCGKDHSMMKVTPDSKCVLECVRHGSKYALSDGKNVYVLSDQKTPEQFAGQKVKVTGTLNEKTKILKVDSIAADGAATSHSGHSH